MSGDGFDRFSLVAISWGTHWLQWKKWRTTPPWSFSMHCMFWTIGCPKRSFIIYNVFLSKWQFWRCTTLGDTPKWLLCIRDKRTGERVTKLWNKDSSVLLCKPLLGSTLHLHNSKGQFWPFFGQPEDPPPFFSEASDHAFRRTAAVEKVSILKPCRVGCQVVEAPVAESTWQPLAVQPWRLPGVALVALGSTCLKGRGTWTKSDHAHPPFGNQSRKNQHLPFGNHKDYSG